MISTLGSIVQVQVFASAQDRAARRDPVIRKVSIVSAGPPGTVGDWGRTVDEPREWVLVRKSLTGGEGSFDAIAGDRGEKELH